MQFNSKNVAIRAGSFFVCVLHIDDAKLLDVWPNDRLEIRHGSKKITAIIDVAADHGYVRPGTIELYKELADKLGTKNVDKVNVEPLPTPISVKYIRHKLEGERLNYDQMYTIVKDIAEHKLTDIEMTYFISGSFVNTLTINEIGYLTKAMVETGEVMKPKKRLVVDKHCTGGVPGNRTTPIVVPIIAAAGLTIPKTSSRSITSPAGTADTVEVLCNVTIPIKKMKQIVDTTGGCMVWGGALNLAPADDNMIKIEHPLSLDAEGNLIASILAKKMSVSADRILIDIPVAYDAKIKSRAKAERLKKKFMQVAKQFGLEIKVIITDGSEPIGNGIGPALEARDILWALQGHERAPKDLIKKSLSMAGLLLEMGRKAKKGQGYQKAKEILESGKAYEKFCEIIKAQGNAITDADKIPIGSHTFLYRAPKTGTIMDIHNKKINLIA
ncbi:thymidine phosphorylase, partial [Candidatus Woesearchaeota archaeon]|nr:thymidine phosphorylase [Candidatus Woesearchaeota archaeon]